jgi:drug/metabolite transporter (DMT)-like permease
MRMNDTATPPPGQRLTQNQIGTLQMLVGTVFISFSAVFVKVSHIGPTMAGFYRVAIGAAFLLIVVVVKRESLWRGWTPLWLAVAAGAFFAADLVTWHRSIHYIGPGLATILANFQVFFLAAISIVFLKERPDWRFLVSIPLAITGLFLLVGVDWGSLDSQYKVGVGLALLCAVMYTGFLLVLRRSQHRLVRLRPTANLTIVSIVTAAMLAPVGALQGESFAIADGQTAWALVAYGVLCQAIGWIIISWAVTKIEASRVGLLLLLQPTLTFIWDILFFDRPTTSIEILGALLTLVAIYFGSARRR